MQGPDAKGLECFGLNIKKVLHNFGIMFEDVIEFARKRRYAK
jgi:hypothetical protein